MAGVDCVDMVNVTDTSAVCVTPKQVTGSYYVGKLLLGFSILYLNIEVVLIII